MNQTSLKIKKIEIDRDDFSVYGITQECTASHSNGKTTLELPVIFRKNPQGWKAELDLSSLKEEETMDEASKKLGSWLMRMGQALIDNNPEQINFLNETISPKFD